MKNIEKITLADIKNGTLSIGQLLEIYDKYGFVFIGDSGKFHKIKKEIK